MIVSANKLTKKFNDFTAVFNVDFEIRSGECFGLLGPNGAGKSTIIEMLYGAASRTAGKLRVFGHDPAVDSRKIKKKLGVVCQENALDEGMSVLDNMLMFARLVGVEKARRRDQVMDMLEFMALDHKANSLISTLSGGMQRRLVFVRALLNDPEFVILDEPTTGLDPAVRQLIWAKIQELVSMKKTVLLTTHYMDEAELLCDRILIMDQGNVKVTGTPKELIASSCPGYIAIIKNTELNQAKLRDISSQFSLSYGDQLSGIGLRAETLFELNQCMEAALLDPEMIRPANLEDAFLAITGRELSVDA